MVLLVLLWIYEMGRRLYKRCGIDREQNNVFFILYILFLISFFLWELPGNVLVVYLFLVSMGMVKPEMVETDLDKLKEKRVAEE